MPLSVQLALSGPAGMMHACVYACACLIRFRANHSQADLMPPNSIPLQLNLDMLAKAIQPPCAPLSCSAHLSPVNINRTLLLSLCVFHIFHMANTHMLYPLLIFRKQLA